MHDRLSTKELILKCAYDIFSEKGFLVGTVREIARRADVNIAAINYYFSSKEILIDMVTDKYLSELYDLFPILENTDVPPMQRLRTYIDRFMSLSTSNIHRNLFMQAFGNENIIPKTMDAMKAHVEIWEKLINEITGIQDKAVLNLKGALISSVVIYPVLINNYGIEVIHLDFHKAEDRNNYIDIIIDTLFPASSNDAAEGLPSGQGNE